MAGAVIGSVGVVVRPITTGLSGSLRKAFSGASGGARSAGTQAGEAYGTGLENQAGNVVTRFGSSLTSAMGRWAKRGAVVGGVALGAAMGASVIGGFRSAVSQQQGQLVLGGLYENAEKASSTLKGLRDMASGSPIDYSAYQGAAETLAYAGAEGETAIGVLENVGKAITAAGGDTSAMDSATGAILRGVNAGQFQLDTLQQLSNAGVPILSGLSEHFGVSMEKVNEMASAGQVQLEDVMAVMENGTGATFQSMITAGEAASQSFGSQWTMAKDNVVTAIGGQMVPLLEKLAPIIGDIGTRLGNWISGLDFTPLVAGISSVVDWAGQLDFSSWKSFTESLAGGGAGAAFSQITDALSGVGPVFSSFIGSLREAAPLLAQVGGTVLTLATGALSFLAQHLDKIILALPVLLGAFAAWRIAVKTQTTLLAVQAPILAYANTLRLASAVVERQTARATNTAAAATTRATVAQRLRTAATKIGTAVSKAAAVATRALGAALRFMTGPIGLVIVAITALVAGLVWFFTQTEAGQAIIQRVWAAIQTAISAVVNWAVNTAWPLLQTVWNGIASGAMWLYQNAILPAWNGISAAISAVVNWIMTTAVPFLQSAWNAIATAVTWLYQNIITPVWNGIRTVIAIVVGIVIAQVELWVAFFQNIVAPMFMWLWRNVLQPVWNGIRAAISAVVTWFQETAWPILQSVIGWIQQRFEDFKLGLQIIWNFIRNNVINPVVMWFQNTVWPVIQQVIDWIVTAFRFYRDMLADIWSFVRWNVIDPVVQWFRNTVWPILQSVIGWIQDRFDDFKTGLQIIWDFIRWNIIQPVIDWFQTNVVDTFQNALDRVQSGFEAAKDAIGRIWDQIKSKIAGPLEIVIDKILNPFLIDNIRKVQGFLGIAEGDRIQRLSLPEGFRGGGILPGQSSWRDGDDQMIAARRGEGVLVSEGLKDRRSQSMFLQANEAARTRGTSFADFVGGAFANGGLVLGSPFRGDYPMGDGFGARGGSHEGIDWAMPSGTPLVAVADGVANQAYNSAAGNKLNLNMGGGLTAGYHHLSRFAVPSGTQVSAGDVVGYVGSTGRSTGPHLHFSVKRNGSYTDPSPYLGEGGAAGGGGWNPFAGLWDTIKEKARSLLPDGGFGDMLTQVPQKLLGDAVSWVKDKIAGIFDFGSDSGEAGAGVDRWRTTAMQALQHTGHYSPANLESMLRRMDQESGGNPRAINNWDSNADRGTPSKGLMQTIGPTFQAYRDPSLPNDIYDPLANMVAAINYTDARYPSLQAGWNRAGGYWAGGLVGPDGGTPTLFDAGGQLPPGITSVLNASGKPEAVLTHDEWQLLERLASGEAGGDTYNYDVAVPDAENVVDELMWLQRTAHRGGRYARKG